MMRKYYAPSALDAGLRQTLWAPMHDVERLDDHPFPTFAGAAPPTRRRQLQLSAHHRRPL